MLIRAVQPRDYFAISCIYSQYVLNGNGSFEEVPPSLHEISQRMDTLLSQGYPVLVVEFNSAVIAYAYAGPYKARSAYRYTVEDSIYIAPEHTGKGLGKKLLKQLLAEASVRGFKQMMAGIGDSENKSSIGLHKSCGFVQVGVAKHVGYKHGRWLDVVYLQYELDATRNDPMPKATD